MLSSCAVKTIIILFSFQALSAFEYLTQFLKIRRKRSLIYQGGTVKLSVGGIWPLYLEDPVNWRQVNCLASLQTQFNLPSKPQSSLQILDLPYVKGLRSMGEEFDKFNVASNPDFSRMFIYAALEEFMNRNGRNGRECLLRSICENSQIDEHLDDFSRMLDVILTPGKDDLDKIYREAVEAGKFGADCLSSYFKCSYGDSFLDRIAVLS